MITRRTALMGAAVAALLATAPALAAEDLKLPRQHVDLVAPPFDAFRKAIASPVKYDATQPLGSAMRAANVELFRFPSAREPGAVNIGVLSPAAFGNSKPRGFETWHCTATRDLVELARRDFASWARETFLFERHAFLVNGVLPAPGLAS